MNLVMQFRKVCNHPDLFERKFVRTSMYFNEHFIYQNMLFFDKNGNECLFGNYQSNPLNVGWSQRLYDFEVDTKQCSQYYYLLYQQKLKYFHMTNQSILWFNYYMSPTKQNLIRLLVNCHYLLQQKQQSIDISSQVRVLQHMYIPKVLANTPKRYLSTP